MFIVFHVLYFALYLLYFSRKELSIDGKKHELKKEENNNNGATKCKLKREREENWFNGTCRVNISHKTHMEIDGQVFRVGEFTCNALETQ